ncbi:MAG: response regulator [Bacteroidota bacterium]
MADRILKLLIVDDEAETREGILHSLPWEKHGLKIAGLATNGREALRMIAEYQPDLMLLDIRMPVMNGLEVLERLAKEKSPVKVIILSGYDDFGYCQQALRYGVSDYLLKPCRPKEILDSLIKLKNQIAIVEEQYHQWDCLLQKFQENLPILRENLLMALIQHKLTDSETALIRWKLYQMEVVPQNIGLALIRIDQQYKLTSPPNEFELIKDSLCQQLESIAKLPPALKTVISYYHDHLIILWNVDSEPLAVFSRRMEQFRQTVATAMPVTVTIGLGEPAPDLSQLHTAFHSAILALEHGFWKGPDRIIHYHEINVETPSPNLAFEQEENLIINYIRSNNQEGLEGAIESFFDNLAIPGKNSKDYIQKMITALICSVYHVCLERGINPESVFGPKLAILDELPRIETLTELHQRILSCFKEIIRNHPLQKNQWKMVTQAVNYIEEHYSEDLTLESVARLVFVSPGYLSVSFKQVLQKNFVDYIAEVRVKKAKELLRDFHLKIYEIAIQIGYKDEKYFSQIFKKITGMAPNQYRDTLKGSVQD